MDHYYTCGRHNGGRSRLREGTAKMQGILIGCVLVFLIMVTIPGPEEHAPYFERSSSNSPLPSSNAVVDVDDGHRRAGQGSNSGWSNNIDSDSGTREYGGMANSSSPIRHTKKFSDINPRN